MLVDVKIQSHTLKNKGICPGYALLLLLFLSGRFMNNYVFSSSFLYKFFVWPIHMVSIVYYYTRIQNSKANNVIVISSSSFVVNEFSTWLLFFFSDVEASYVWILKWVFHIIDAYKGYIFIYTEMEGVADPSYTKTNKKICRKPKTIRKNHMYMKYSGHAK